MTPFGEFNEEMQYISRKSLCDECKAKLNCISVKGNVECCAQFNPLFVMFTKCRECGQSYEIHTAWKNDFLDECPDCGNERRKARLARLPEVDDE